MKNVRTMVLSRFRVGLGAILLLALTMPGMAVPRATQPTAATYRVVVTADELASWKAFRAHAPFLRGQAAIDGLVLVSSLANAAESSGIADRPDVRVELMRADGKEALAWLRARVTAHIAVSEEAIDAALLAAPPRDRPRRVRLRNLFLRWPDSDRDRRDVREQMAAIRQAIDDGADFAAMASQHSQSETRWRGGLLGNVRPGTFPAEVERIIEGLTIGETSAPIESPDGLTLLHCEDILEAASVDASAWRARITNRLRRRTFDAQWKAQVEQLDALAARKMLDNPVRPEAASPTADESANNGPENALSDMSIAVRYRGGSLTIAELAAVAGARTREALAEISPARLETAVSAFVRGQVARQVRAESGWRADDETRESQRWQHRQILASHQLAALVNARFEPPTEAALRAHHHDHAEHFVHPAEAVISLIQLPRDADAPRADVARAVSVLRDIRAGRIAFAEAARRHSVHPSATRGGQLGAIEQPALTARLGIDLARAADSLEVDVVSELITTEDALWILRLDAESPSRPSTFEESRGKVRRALIAERLDALQEEVASDWLTSLSIESGNGLER